ncbi:tetratricopeptide repeat protein [Nonomuraea sp. NPDC050478]|uniref:tetratricopeptide repeat protein n=1 Tax=unclassified Nonomuraea TaxID=2593643 RepID=UPI0011CE1F7E|nr:tetratricopeptide repeat protein [Nonomuraea sp. C10]TXK39692.1 tetratricopeptide repeat protein [Nonomuraea sp. C10]
MTNDVLVRLHLRAGVAMPSSGSGFEPYVGLSAYRREDATRFFGREAEAAALAHLWRNHRVTILHGPSGVGKTSLVTAGVLPLLAGSDVLPLGSVRRPSVLPAAAILDDSDPHAFALMSSWSPHEHPLRLSGLTISTYLRWHHWNPDGGTVMAVFDHAEELFTAHRRHPDGHIHLLDQLSDALSGDPPLHLLIVIADEHLEPLQRHEGMRTHMTSESFIRLEPFAVDAALEACRRPLVSCGRELAPGVAEKLVDELRADRSTTVEPAHLQLVCEALWKSTNEKDTPIGDADLVDVDKVLADHCDRTIQEVARDLLDGDVDQLVALLRPIVTNGTDGEDLPPRVAQALTRGRILRRGEKGRYEMPARLVGPFLSTSFGRQQPEPPNHVSTIEAALQRGWFEFAAKQAERALRNSADGRSRARAESLAGDAAYLLDDFDGAIAHYREAAMMYATMRGTDRIVATFLAAIGRILVDQGAYQEAIRELRAAVKRSPEPVILTELAWALWYIGHESGAVDMLDAALRSGNNPAEALRVRGEILSDIAPQSALRDLDRVRPHELASTRAAYALALALSGDVVAAVRALPRLDADSDATTLLRTARVMKKAGQDLEAARLARRAQQSASRKPLPPRLTAQAELLIAT